MMGNNRCDWKTGINPFSEGLYLTYFKNEKQNYEVQLWINSRWERKGIGNFIPDAWVELPERPKIFDSDLEEAQDIIQEILFCENLPEETMNRVNKFLKKNKTR